MNQALRQELLALAEQDQSFLGSPEHDQDSDEVQRQRLELLGRLRRRLVEILDTYGWPGRSLVGEDGAEAAWALALHVQTLASWHVHPRLAIQSAQPGLMCPGRSSRSSASAFRPSRRRLPASWAAAPHHLVPGKMANRTGRPLTTAQRDMRSGRQTQAHGQEAMEVLAMELVLEQE
jgi:hypothetical protein